MRRDQDAVAIGSLYHKGRKAIVDSVRYHLQAGRKLNPKKTLNAHGEWVPWLRANADVLGFKHRTTASRLMKAAAANDASTHHLERGQGHPDKSQALGQSSRRNHAGTGVQGSRAQEKDSRWQSGRRPRSPIAASRPCVHLSNIPSLELQRAHARRTKFELLFEALGEIIVDVQRQTIETDDEARRYIRRRIRIQGPIVEMIV